jgi:hypothetical protein
MPSFRLWRSWSAAALLLFSLVLVGCSSSGRGRTDRPAPQPLLFGRTAYFDGAVIVEATLGPFRLQPAGGPLDRRPPGPDDGEPIPVSRGDFGQRGERETGTGFPRGPREEGSFGGGGGGARRTGAGGPGGAGTAGAMPRQSLVVTLRSTSTDATSLRVAQVKSALGNFVPVPETFTLAPGATQELEPMRASYPAAIDELELLVSLRRAGREETQVVKLTLAERTPAR